MDFLSKFAESLKSLTLENNLTATTLSEKIDINLNSISSFLRGDSLPSLESLIKLADFFNCTTDYVLGLENENSSTVFYKCPPFTEQLKVVKARIGKPWCKFYEETEVSSARFYEWKNGKHQPSVENIIKLAIGLNVSVDFMIGRSII